MSQSWHVRLTHQAELDLLDIAQWTIENFGAKQADYYIDTISRAIVALSDGPAIVGTKTRNELGLGIGTLHAGRYGRKARHFVIFRVVENQMLDVLRVLHDSMDLARHLPAANDSNWPEE